MENGIEILGEKYVFIFYQISWFNLFKLKAFNNFNGFISRDVFYNNNCNTIFYNNNC